MTRDLPVPAAPGTPQSSRQYLVFALAGETFAIDILHIKEIIEYGTVTQVPMMPALVRGVINLRGAVVPVIDLGLRFGRGRTVASRRTCIVIVEVGAEEETQTLGILVDAVIEVLEIAPGDIEPAPSFGARIRSEFIAGMAKVHGKFVILLDVDHALSLNEMADLTSLTEAAPETPHALRAPGSN